MLIIASTNAAEIERAYRRYANELGKDLAKVMRRALANWCFKARKAMRREGFGRTSRMPNLPLPGDRHRRKWRLVAWLWKGRRQLGMALPETRSEFARKERGARNSSKGFLRWMVVTAASAARKAMKTGNGDAKSARGIVARAKGSMGKLGGATATAELSSVFKFKIERTRALKPQAAESARRRILSAFSYVVPEVVADCMDHVRKELEKRARKEGVAA